MPAWYNPSWLYQIPLTIDNTANTTSALSYHQVAVSLTGAAYASFHAHAKSDGSDIRVTDSDGTTLLGHTLEGIDTANNAVYLLVKVPRVAAGATRTIYVYYGNSSATSVSSYAATVNPTTLLTGPTDIYNQSDTTGFNANPVSVLLKNQGGVHGGGASLNGQILCFILSGAVSNSDRSNGNVLVMSSTNGGATFGGKTALVTHDSTHMAEPRSVGELADGTILLCYSTDTNTNASAGKAQAYVAKSTDGGATWSNLALSGTAANHLVVPWTYGTNKGAPYGRFIERTAGGDLYLPVYGVLTGDTGWHQWLLKCPSGSDPTDGSNWVVQGTVAFDNSNLFAEGSILQTTDANHYLAVMRSNTAADLYTCTSADSGVTWTSPARVGLPGGTTNNVDAPDLLTLASGNILLTWTMRYGAAYGIGGVVSTDGGATWLDRVPMDIATGANATVWDTGYSSAVQNADGSICVVFYYPSGAITTVNVSRVLITEDYVVNCNNHYASCDSFGTQWVSHGANVTISATHVHSGSNAISVDNSAGTGGTADTAAYQAWSTNAAQATGKVAVSFWKYETSNDTNDGFKILDATDSLTNPNHQRIQIGVFGNNSQHLEWHNGTAYQDTAVPVPLNQWNKQTVRANVGASSATGQLLVNNTSATNGLGQSASGSAPQYAYFIGASQASTHNVIYWVDDLYTHQYTAHTPTVTAGSERDNTGAFVSYPSFCQGVGSGLLGNVGYTVYALPSGATIGTRKTSGVSAVGSHCYAAYVQIPFTGGVLIEWDDGAGNFYRDAVQPRMVEPPSGAYPSGLNDCQAWQLCLAESYGRTSGFVPSGNSSVTWKAPDEATTRASGVVDPIGNRTSVTLTPLS